MDNEGKKKHIVVLGGELGFNRFLWSLHRREDELVQQIGSDLEDYGILYWKTSENESGELAETSSDLQSRLDEVAVIVITKPAEGLSVEEESFLYEADKRGIKRFFRSELLDDALE